LELPKDLLRMMGYAKGSYSLGFIDGGRDPIIAARPEFQGSGQPLAELARWTDIPPWS